MHNVQALIGRFEVNAFADPSKAIPLPQGLFLVPVNDVFYRAKCEIDPPSVIQQFEFLTPEFLSWLKHVSIEQTLAYVETDYFGGDGGQGAILLSNGEIIYGPSFGDEEHINSVLRLLGVKVCAEEHDEFGSVGLGNYRSSQEWLASTEG
ncbi:hypothetical protein IB234_23365 [Pseudomonas sp. PDM16]|uniref:hypothetical protein n=1 Tax=Pseudomonas sp. PDM16 TaxID=2769292 RepID=UPI001780C281|nr:hypothetical protein [Pseudomonas sp. PDM16]MBD9417515.1 hypothetical protein [Pseudomonas sp. PDM16]